MSKKLPRGFRNNNPFNIKKSSVVWLGECKGDDKVFETFSSLELGIRAGLKLLANYVSNGFDTPRKIIARFAPYSENDTESYIHFICDNFSPFVSADDVISVKSNAFFVLCARIIQYENGLSGEQMAEYHCTVTFLSYIFKKYCLS